MDKTNVFYAPDARVEFLSSVWRPSGFARDGGIVVNGRGSLNTNAFLNREEWEVLDREVFERGKERLNILSDLQAAGLSSQIDPGVWLSKWRVASERIAAGVKMDFGSNVNMDRVDKKTYAVPVPIYSAPYYHNRREIMTARRYGTDIDATDAGEAAAAVVDQVENVIVNGRTDVQVDGNDIPGLRTLAARTTGTAASFGGGDFGTLSNIRPTFLGVITALNANRYYGPFNIYISNTQYHQMRARHTDGSGQTALQTVEELLDVNFVKPNDRVPDGEMVWYQPTRNVIDLKVAMTLTNQRWESPDQSQMFFVAMWMGVARLKTDYAGNSGVAQVTSC